MKVQTLYETKANRGMINYECELSHRKNFKLWKPKVMKIRSRGNPKLRSPAIENCNVVVKL